MLVILPYLGRKYISHDSPMSNSVRDVVCLENTRLANFQDTRFRRVIHDIEYAGVNLPSWIHVRLSSLTTEIVILIRLSESQWRCATLFTEHNHVDEIEGLLRWFFRAVVFTEYATLWKDCFDCADDNSCSGQGDISSIILTVVSHIYDHSSMERTNNRDNTVILK